MDVWSWEVKMAKTIVSYLNEHIRYVANSWPRNSCFVVLKYKLVWRKPRNGIFPVLRAFGDLWHLHNKICLDPPRGLDWRYWIVPPTVAESQKINLMFFGFWDGLNVVIGHNPFIVIAWIKYFDNFFENWCIQTRFMQIRASTILSSARISAWLPETTKKSICQQTKAHQKNPRPRH